MKMTIHQRDDNLTMVVMTGRLDSSGVEEISESFADALGAATQSTIFDLAEIDFLASRGLGLLIAHGEKLTKNGHKLILLNPTEMVESVLITTKLDNILPISHDLDDAIRKLGGVPAPQASIAEPAEADREQPVPVSSAPDVTEGELKLTIENELSELKDLNATVTEFLSAHGVPHRTSFAVQVAIDELLNNVIRYAYVDDELHSIDIEIAITAEQIILQITDDGRPFDPRKGPSLDLHCEDREVAELGLLLILEMVDVLKYRRIEDTNMVEVRIHLFAEDQPGDLTGTPGEHSDVG